MSIVTYIIGMGRGRQRVSLSITSQESQSYLIWLVCDVQYRLGGHCPALAAEWERL